MDRPLQDSVIIFSTPRMVICILLQASDFRVDGAKSPEILQKEGVLGSEIAARNRKSLATFHRTLKSQCKVSEIASDFWGPRWASQSQIAKIAGISALSKNLNRAIPSRDFQRTSSSLEFIR